MAKKTNSAKTKKAETKVIPPVENNTKETVEQPVTIETVTEAIGNKGFTPIQNTGSLDANHLVQLNGQIIDMFLKNPNAVNMFGDKVCATMTRIGAIGVISAVADQAINGTGTFAITVKREAYENLKEAALSIGVELPAMTKLLPGTTKDSVKIESKDINVSEETTKKIKEENAIEKEGDNNQIELDPKKVAHLDEEALIKALTYLLVTGLKRNKSIKDSLVETVDFMHDYRIELARQAENSTDAMNKYEDRSMYEWLSDIFSYVKPTIHLKGIGIGMHSLIKEENAPLSAFVILRQVLIDNKTNQPLWDDKSIADTVKALVEVICKDHIEAETKNLESLDKKEKGYRKLASQYECQIKREKEVLQYLNDPSFDIIPKYGTSEEVGNTIITKAFVRLKKMYYPNCMDTSKGYIGLVENLRQKAGIILNLFKDPSEQNLNYSSENLSEIKELSMIEYAKFLKEKEETDKKKD